ncbi:hypothetical protein CAEBREN_28304 [Caenorhabditis brenneri]|uniref:Carboxylic ester hydrolase n=1 Tax=Caenorhabditis brenneri TaxID=135651 RepID=G0MSA0_CAEBE|nr:hypothetical protein CAEBREN_28304 [Caenorhabditis brenneri]
MLFLWFFIVSSTSCDILGTLAGNKQPDKNPNVLDVPCGPIRGNIYTFGTKIVDGYLGIPFAKPPVGDLKFKKPVPFDKWTEPRDCYDYGPGCPQTGQFAGLTATKTCPFAENNCLTLNVFAPRWKSDEFPNGLPVLVYIYGGGFEIGYTSYMDGYAMTGNIPQYDIVVVTMNYRLGPLGFLTVADGLATGNYGLWDQTMALQWVQDNIAAFGGDPNKVTLSGTSAGSASTDFLSLSPHANSKSKEASKQTFFPILALFQRSISMSGTAFCNFAIRPQRVESAVGLEYAQLHGYTGNDSKSLLQWYLDQDVSVFKDATGYKYKEAGVVPFVPNFDGDFFPEPFDILRKKAPTREAMVTVTEMESVGMIIYNKLFVDPYNNFEGFINETYGTDVTDYYAAVVKNLTSFYLGDVSPLDKNKTNYRVVNYVSDSVFNSGTLDAVRSYAKYGNKVYLGSFNYFNKASTDLSDIMQPFKAASHSTDFKYYFGSGVMTGFKPNDEEKKVMGIVQNLMANFVKYGVDPNGKNATKAWKPYSLNQPLKYYQIDYPSSQMADNFQDGRIAIYDIINKNSKKYQEIVYGGKLTKSVKFNRNSTG